MTGLRRLIAACTSWMLVSAGPYPAGPAPARPVPTTPDPAPRPAAPDPAPYPAGPAPARPDPANSGPARPTPVWPSQPKSGPVRPDPAAPAAAPAASTPPWASCQEIAARPPAAWSIPRQPPSLVTMPPDRTVASAYRRRAATISPGRAGATDCSPPCSQLSHRATATSAVARMSASGSCLGSQWPSPANAAPRWSSRPGSPEMPPRYAATCRGPAVSPATAAAGPVASSQIRPAPPGTISHNARHLVILPTAYKAAASTIVSWAKSTCTARAATPKAATISPSRGVPLGISWRARRGARSAAVAAEAGIPGQGSQSCKAYVQAPEKLPAVLPGEPLAGDSTTIRNRSGRSTATVSAAARPPAGSSNRTVIMAAGCPADSRRLLATAGGGGCNSTKRARGRQAAVRGSPEAAVPGSPASTAAAAARAAPSPALGMPDPAGSGSAPGAPDAAVPPTAPGSRNPGGQSSMPGAASSGRAASTAGGTVSGSSPWLAGFPARCLARYVVASAAGS